jgi:hypothetical protein
MLEILRAIFADHADKLPFVIANTSMTSVRISTQRLLEAVIIGAILAGIGYVAVIPRLEERMTVEIRQVRDDIGELKRKVESIDAQRDKDYRELSREVMRRNAHQR